MADMTIVQHECSNSLAPDSFCGPELIDRAQELRELWQPETRLRFIFWGYSKGGNTILEALRGSPELRDLTHAVITLGSPLGGSAALLMAGPTLSDLVGVGTLLAGASPGADVTGPAGWLAQMHSPVRALAGSRATDLWERLAPLLRQQPLAQAQDGFASLLPRARRRYLEDLADHADFTRNDGSAIRMFQIAAITDLATFHPSPLLRVRQGRVALDFSEVNTDHVGELAFTPMLRHFPFSDTCVALQHAVIPRHLVPQGLLAEMIGLFSFDHSGHRLTPMPGSFWDQPHLAMVDAILADVAHRLTHNRTEALR